MMLTNVATKLGQNLNLVKKHDALTLIHARTKRLALAICNARDDNAISLRPKKLPKPALDQPVVQTLCSTALDVVYFKTPLQVLQTQANAMAANAAKFKVDELLLVLCPYAVYTGPYCRPFRVNHGDFRATLAVYARHLLGNLSEMSLEQLYFTLTLFEKLRRRHAGFTLSDHPVLSSLVSKLIFFAENLPKTDVPAAKAATLHHNRFSAEVRGLGATLQTVYNCYFPYFRMIYTSYDAFRVYADYLAKAAVQVQALVLQNYSAGLGRHFEDLAQSLAKVLPRKFLRLSSQLALVNFFARNRDLFPRASAEALCELVNRLAISLHALTAHTYVALDAPQPDDGDFADVALRMFARVLENLHIRDIVRCLPELALAGHLNRNMLMLFVPYIVNDLPVVKTSHLLDLMAQLTEAGLHHWLLWVVLCRAVKPKNLGTVDPAIRDRFFAALRKQNEHLVDAAGLAAVGALRFVHVTDVGDELGPERHTPLFAILKAQLELAEPDLPSLLASYAGFLGELDAFSGADAVGADNRQRLETLAGAPAAAGRAEAQI